MCGEHRNIIACICVSLGSSPHVRGAQKHCRHRRGVPGIIPACAGSTSTPTTRNPTQWDHPRMCGEHRSGFNALFFLTGSSPHVRGARKDSPLRRCHSGIIPACAGSTLTLAVSRSRARDHPRMCGEHLDAGSEQKPCPGSSPHVRGALLRLLIAATIGGIIPACAGSTSRADYPQVGERDHPRMCGEHCLAYG